MKTATVVVIPAGAKRPQDRKAKKVRTGPARRPLVSLVKVSRVSLVKRPKVSLVKVFDYATLGDWTPDNGWTPARRYCHNTLRFAESAK